MCFRLLVKYEAFTFAIWFLTDVISLKLTLTKGEILTSEIFVYFCSFTLKLIICIILKQRTYTYIFCKLCFLSTSWEGRPSLLYCPGAVFAFKTNRGKRSYTNIYQGRLQKWVHYMKHPTLTTFYIFFLQQLIFNFVNARTYNHKNYCNKQNQLIV